MKEKNQGKGDKKGKKATAKSGKRAENKERTKKAILEAALGLFGEKGFHSTTTKEISKKAGIAEGTLFNYFRSKEDLALYFIEQSIEDLISWYGEQEELQGAPVSEKLFAVVHRFLEHIGPYEDFIGAVYLRALQPMSKLSPLSLERQESNVVYLKFIKGILDEAEEAGEIPPLGDFGAYGFGLFQLAILTHWLKDLSPNKEETLALLDRCLSLGTNLFTKGGWEW